MPNYFMPDHNNGNNYSVKRKRKNGYTEFYQLPSEGIYTKHEMSQIIDKVPGKWIKTKPDNKAYIFGLRQLIDKEAYTLA